MNKIYFTVGPSQLYPTVKEHIKNALSEDIPSISHRGEYFMEMNRGLQEDLRSFMNIPEGHRIFFLSSAHEAMERTIENTVSRQSFHFVNGSFSKIYYNTSLLLKKKAAKVEVAPNEGFELNKIKIPSETELICITQNETGTGTTFPMEDIYRLKEKYPEMLIAIDVVSSAPYVDIDFKKVDMVFFSVQKGFGLPAGLGIIIVNERAFEKAEWLSQKGESIGSYHNFLTLEEKNTIFQTKETPNVLAIYLLRKVLQDMIKEGIEKIRRDTDEKAKMLYEFFDNSGFDSFPGKNIRSQTTLVIDVKGRSKDILKKLAEKGVIAGKGYGDNKDNHIRIANFPAHKITHVKKLIADFPKK